VSLLTNLVSSYTFENASPAANIGLDSSGSAHHLTLTGSVPQAAGNAAPGTHGSSWSDGGVSAAQGVLSAAVNVIPPATSFSISLWVNTITGNWQSTGYDPFAAGIQGGGSDQYYFQLNHTSLTWYFVVSGGGAGGTAALAGSAITLGTWHHLVGQFDTGSKNTSIVIDNGAPVSVASGIIDPYQAAPRVFSIGSNGNGGGFPYDGTIDGLSLWNRLLAAGEIAQLWNGGAGLEYPFPGGRRRTGVTMM
jgi:hypothetical protein